MSEPLDLNQLVRKGTVELGPEEQPDERAARLRREERRDRREHVLFFVVLGGVLAVAGTCGYVLFFAAQTPGPTRQHAQTVLTGIVSGGVAFLFGRNLPKG